MHETRKQLDHRLRRRRPEGTTDVRARRGLRSRLSPDVPSIVASALASSPALSIGKEFDASHREVKLNPFSPKTTTGRSLSQPAGGSLAILRRYTAIFAARGGRQAPALLQPRLQPFKLRPQFLRQLRAELRVVLLTTSLNLPQRPSAVTRRRLPDPYCAHSATSSRSALRHPETGSGPSHARTNADAEATLNRCRRQSR